MSGGATTILARMLAARTLCNNQANKGAILELTSIAAHSSSIHSVRPAYTTRSALLSATLRGLKGCDLLVRCDPIVVDCLFNKLGDCLQTQNFQQDQMSCRPKDRKLGLARRACPNLAGARADLIQVWIQSSDDVVRLLHQPLHFLNVVRLQRLSQQIRNDLHGRVGCARGVNVIPISLTHYSGWWPHKTRAQLGSGKNSPAPGSHT